jgi:hypothetical protein
MTTTSARKLPDWARSMLRWALVGAVCGAAGVLVGRTLASVYPDITLPELPDLRWSDGLALYVAFCLAAGGVYAAIVSLNRAALGKMLKLEEPATPSEVRLVRWSGALLLLTAAIMLMPPAFSLLGTDPLLSLAAVAGMLGLHTVLNLKIWKDADELLRRTTMEASVVTFWGGQIALFGWAAAERAGIAPTLTAWDVYVVLMALYLVASTVITIRRGLA